MTLRPFNSLRPYNRSWLRLDLVGGLTVWAVLVPEALAVASIAGVSPVVGLYAAPGALLLYAILGGSRLLIIAPTSAAAALSAAAVGEYAPAGAANFVILTAALAVVAGLIAILAGLLRLGFLSNFISEPVFKGFIIGLALTIIVGQLPKLFGVEGGSGDFFQKLWHLIGNLGETDGATLAIGAASLVLILAMKRISPAVPAYLVAVIGGVLAVRLLNLDQHGVAIVGDIQGGLPSFGVPDASAGDYLKLAPGAAGVALIAFAEGFGAAKAYAPGRGRQGGRRPGADWPRRCQRRGRPLERHGRRRQPLENRREPLRWGALPALGRARRGPGGHHSALPHPAVRGPAGGDSGRGRYRRGDRTGRPRIAAPPLPGS